MKNRLGTPIGDRIIVKLSDEQVDKTAGGIYIPDSAKNDDVKRAEVVASGAGLYTANGIKIPMTVQVGDVVVLPPYHQGIDIKIDGEKYIVLRETDLLMIL